MKTVIAVDAMGGDHGPSVTVPASADFLEAHPDSELILVGLPDRIEAGTFAVGAAMTKGDVLLEGARPEHMEAMIAKLRAARSDREKPGPSAASAYARGRIEAPPSSS